MSQKKPSVSCQRGHTDQGGQERRGETECLGRAGKAFCCKAVTFLVACRGDWEMSAVGRVYEVQIAMVRALLHKVSRDQRLESIRNN